MLLYTLFMPKIDEPPINAPSPIDPILSEFSPTVSNPPLRLQSLHQRFFELHIFHQVLIAVTFLIIGIVIGAGGYYYFTDATLPPRVRSIAKLPPANEQPQTAPGSGMNDPDQQLEKTQTPERVNASKDSDMGQLLSGSKTAEFTAEQINSAQRGFFSLSPGTSAKNGVDRHVINYVSQDKDGKPITILGQVFVPKLPEGTVMPVYVFGAGTTGLDDHCAPSKENPAVRNWGNYLQHMLVYASQGYIVVFPDYEGFNDPDRIHHYFIGKLEGQVLLDGARAITKYAKSNNIQHEEKIFFAGYSEGGHAAFAVKDIAPTYAPDIKVGGVIGYGATSNIEALIRENPGLIPYLIYAYSDYYGIDNFNPKDYLKERWVKTLKEDVLRMCIDQMGAYYGSSAANVYTTEFGTALFSRNLGGAKFGNIKKYFDENSTGYVKNDIPMYVVQGGIDPIVTVASQKEFVRASCNNGNKITYSEFPGVHHYQIRQVSLQESLDWAKEIREGKDVRDDCGKI
jgi:predicted esterase